MTDNNQDSAFDLAWEEARREALTPRWLGLIEPQLKEMIQERNWDRLEGAVGTMIGLFDYCRMNMPQEDWEYVLGQLQRI